MITSAESTAAERGLVTGLLTVICLIGSVCWLTVGSDLVPCSGSSSPAPVLGGIGFCVAGAAMAMYRARVSVYSPSRRWMLSIAPAAALCLMGPVLTVYIRGEFYGINYRVWLVVLLMWMAVLVPALVCAVTWRVPVDNSASWNNAKMLTLIVSLAVGAAAGAALVCLNYLAC